MWSLVAFAGLALMVIGSIGVIRPMPKLFLPTRKRAALAVLLGFVALGIGAVNDQSAAGARHAGATPPPLSPPTSSVGESAQAIQEWKLIGQFGMVRTVYVSPDGLKDKFFVAQVLHAVVRAVASLLRTIPAAGPGARNA